jgi:hypothetical protein
VNIRTFLRSTEVKRMAPQSSSPASAGSDLPATVSTTGFSASHTLQEGTMVICLRGNADSDVASLFGDYLRARHLEAQRLAVREVVLDCRDLYFLTSSCIKGLASWIKWLMSLDPEAQYSLTFRMTPNLRWQERSFDVLCQMCPSRVGMTTR